ncbi:MAG: hypothetical protein IJF67_06105, partial [Clostridia bacterium]|nr:hypothetical protein [Clostridia bacterium]
MTTKRCSKHFTLLLAMLMLAGCGEAAPSADTTASSAPETTAAVTEDPALIPDLEVRDFGGTEFCTTTFENVNFHYNTIAEEENGDTLNDAIFKRNQTVEETYNINMTQFLYPDSGDGRASIKSSVLAGDDAYNVIVLRPDMALSWWTEGLLIAMDEIPNINLDKKYWDK